MISFKVICIDCTKSAEKSDINLDVTNFPLPHLTLVIFLHNMWGSLGVDFFKMWMQNVFVLRVERWWRRSFKKEWVMEFSSKKEDLSRIVVEKIPVPRPVIVARKAIVNRVTIPVWGWECPYRPLGDSYNLRDIQFENHLIVSRTQLFTQRENSVALSQPPPSFFKNLFMTFYLFAGNVGNCVGVLGALYTITVLYTCAFVT